MCLTGIIIYRLCRSTVVEMSGLFVVFSGKTRVGGMSRGRATDAVANTVWLNVLFKFLAFDDTRLLTE